MTPITRRWLATTTLNDNLLRASFLPLLEAHKDMELLFVTDRVGAPMERVRYIVPSPLATKLFGRLLARYLVLRRVIREVERVEVFNTVPHLLLAAGPARRAQIPLDLHMFAGPYELDFANNPSISDNRVIRRRKRPTGLQALFRRLALKNCSRFFVPGIRTQTFLRELGVPADKIVKLHSAIDTDKFSPNGNSRDIDVIIVAGMRAVKRPELTLEILGRILHQRPSSKFVWLGAGELFGQIKTRVENSPLKFALTLVGHTEDVSPYYQRAKVFLLNSISEGMSCAAMEAMSSGVVPVTADVGDMAEIVRTGDTGVLINDHSNPLHYADSILNFLSDETQRESFAHSARDLIVREHSFPAIVEIWKSIS